MIKVIILVLLLPLFGSGETDTLIQKKYPELGITIGAAASQDLAQFTDITFKKGKFLLGAGPVLMHPSVTSRNIELKDLKLAGIHGTLQFNPNKSSKRVDFFFQFQTLYYSWQYVSLTPSYFIHKYANLQIRRTYFGNYLGYGFRIKFLKHFFVSNSIAGGFAWTQTSAIYDDDLRSNSSSEHKQFSVFIQLSISYCFPLKKTKVL